MCIASYYFVANLLMTTPCTKCYKNRPSFMEDGTENIWLTFFLDSVYIIMLSDVFKLFKFQISQVCNEIRRFFGKL